MAEDESRPEAMAVSLPTDDGQPGADVAVFRAAITRLVLDAAYIAVFLVLEWGLTTLVVLTLGARSSGSVGVVINVIQIGSALVAAVFFALHFVAALVRYSIHLMRDFRRP